MPRSFDQKLKIIYIRDYLERHSNPDHPVNAAELIEMLKRDHEIDCERKTIYSDIRALQNYGMDIVSLPGKDGGQECGAGCRARRGDCRGGDHGGRRD